MGIDFFSAWTGKTRIMRAILMHHCAIRNGRDGRVGKRILAGGRGKGWGWLRGRFGTGLEEGSR